MLRVMSLRMPQNLSSGLAFETGESVLQTELMAEQAASLGRAGKRVEKTLAALRRSTWLVQRSLRHIPRDGRANTILQGKKHLTIHLMLRIPHP